MLLPVHILLYALALTICPVPISVATNLQQSVKSSTPYPRKPASETCREPSRARLFTSTAIGLLSLPKDPFRDNMTAGIESLLTPALLQEVRDFWFQHLDDADSFVIADQEVAKRWYMGGQAFDQTCVERFAPTLEALHALGINNGNDILQALKPSNPHDWLSLILLLDQIPRNCYRGASSGIVFRFYDPLAKDIALAAIERGVPDGEPEIRWQFSYRSWFFLPLMHSEDPAAHEKAMEGYGLMAKDVHDLVNTVISGEDEYRAKAAKVIKGNTSAANTFAETQIDFEKRHYDIIKRFGRYPHRNEALGRENTIEETEYLEGGGETFGNKAS